MTKIETSRLKVLRLLREQNDFLHNIINKSRLLKSGKKRNLNTEQVRTWVNTLQGETRKVEKLDWN